MPEVISSVDTVFGSPEFDDAYRNRLVTLYQLEINREKLAEALRKFYESPDRSEYEVSYWVEGMLESSPETLREIFGSNRDITIFKDLCINSEIQLDELDEALIEAAKQQGMGEFALYGLWRYTRDDKVTEKTALKQQVEATENDLAEFASYIQSNSGKLLTHLSLLGVYAARFSSGEVTLDDMRRLIVPTDETRPVYAMSFMPADTEVYEQKTLAIDPIDIIDGSAVYHDSWTPLLRQSEDRTSRDRSVFAVGEVVEGPLYLSGENQLRDVDFYRTKLDRIRTVGRLAAGQTANGSY